jgi:hypothetical protein
MQQIGEWLKKRGMFQPGGALSRIRAAMRKFAIEQNIHSTGFQAAYALSHNQGPKLVLVKFVGTHAEYDRIDPKTVSWRKKRSVRFAPKPTMTLRSRRSSDTSNTSTPDANRFDLLALIIEDYERKRWPIEPPDTIVAIRYRMETGGYTRADLGRLLGSRQRASDILSR